METISTKIFLILFLFASLFTSCSNEADFIISEESESLESILKVKLYDGDINNRIAVTTDYIIDKWEKTLKEEGYNIKLQKFEILESFDSEKGEKTYFLKTKSIDGSLETGAFMTKDKDGSYVLRAKQCTCEGCPNGCHLEISGSTCTCSDCSQDSNKSCKKTETVVIIE